MTGYAQAVTARLLPRLKDPNDGPLKCVWLVSVVLVLTLIWGFQYPPFIDAANVAYSGEVLHDLFQGGAVYGKWYALRPHTMSHMAYYCLYHWLRFLFSPMVSTKVLVTLSVLGLPVAVAGLLHSLGRSLWLSVPAFALAFNTNLNMGYLPFVLGIPLIPLCLMLIEQNAKAPTRWRWVLLAVVLIASLWVHFFLAAVLYPIALLWAFLALRGRSRLLVPAAVGVAVGLVLWLAVGTRRLPPWHAVFQWIPFAERWDQFDRDVLQWTLDGAPALSFPWLLLAFVTALVLSHGIPSRESGLQAAKGPIVSAALFLGYLLGPNYVSWPEPAWGFGTRLGVAFAISLLFVQRASATGWKQIVPVLPWLAFTFWHLLSLVSPFRVYDATMRPLSELSHFVPAHSRILPLVGSEWLKDPASYSFGGFTGFVFRHAGKWLAVERAGYQPWSFCDAGYHPFRCTTRPLTPKTHWATQLDIQVASNYDYVLVLENAPTSARPPAETFRIERKLGQWALWRRVH